MRVHQLSLTAFGPFAGTVDVDFDAAARDGLFLLWGPTGAGKTTLLDAVVYALYGTVPGVRGHDKRLRSDHAESAVRTEVSCEVTLAGERLRVVRRPEQSRPKKRGTGLTSEPARLVVARRRCGEWEPVSTRIDEGSEYLAGRLGLSAEQFCQVVLLPQGDFARFLRAEPEDRARLLGTLFDVGRFARAEEWLAAERRSAEEALRAERVRTSTLLARVAQIADVEVPEALAPELVGAAPGGPVDAWVTQVRSGAAAGLAAAEAAAAEAAEESKRVDAEITAARALAERHVRRDRARQELQALTAEETMLAPVRDRRNCGRRAEVLRDVLQAATRADWAVAAATAELDRAAAAWRADAPEKEASLELGRGLRDAVAEVRAMLPDARRAEELRRKLREHGGELARLERTCAAGEQALGGYPSRLAEQALRVAEAQAAAVRLPGLQEAAAAEAAALAAAHRAETVAAALAHARGSAEQAREGWLGAREHLLDVRARRLDGMAAELAAALSDGEHCPVCGATEHPRPAQGAGGGVRADDEERARQDADAAGERATVALRAVEELERELAVLDERRGGRSAAELADRVRRTGAERNAAAALADALERLSAAHGALSAEREEAEEQLRADREEVLRRTAERLGVQVALAELEERLDAARGTDPDLATRMRRLGKLADRCDALVLARAEEARSRTVADGALALAEQRAAAEGFADVAAAAAALLDPGELAATERRIDEHERRLTAVGAVLAEPELADLGPPPDLERLSAGCAAATDRREAAVATLEQARRCAGALEQLAGDVVAAEVELDERRAQAERVAALADLVNGRGSNALRMRLQSFVLAARLEQVADVASRRLREMSAGRYTFLHSDAQGRHGARGGLGLDVFDEYTGVRRPTKTLSGGESFMAALALALGLADVVTAETGGVEIETLFVDEGFGTLDAGALDAVMTVLDELRRGGRTVGVISHVEELRTRIPARLEVVAGRHGSRLAG